MDEVVESNILVPAFLEQVDFDSVDWTSSGLHLSRPSWEGPIARVAVTPPTAPPTGATVSCLVEGSQQLHAAPLSLPWKRIQCEGDFCFIEDNPETTKKDYIKEENNKEDIYKNRGGQHTGLDLRYADILPGDCVYLPAGWTGWTRTLSSSVSFDLVWKDDLELVLHEDDPLWEEFDLWDEDGALCEDLELCDEGDVVMDEDDALREVDDPQCDEDDLKSSPDFESEDVSSRDGSKRSSRVEDSWPSASASSSSQASTPTPLPGRSPTLADYLPEHLLRRRRILWSDLDPVPHLVGRYLLPSGSKDFEEFTDELRNDGVLLPHLVDCPAECLTVIRELFRALDLDGDLLLTDRDLTCFTPGGLDTLTHTADELLNDLRDLSKDQWSSLKKSRPEEVASFLQRAKGRQEASARATARGLLEGSISAEQEDLLKKHLPELYDQILDSRKKREKEYRDEL